MCGIAGILRYNENSTDRSEIETMTRILSHRGPDGEGFFIQGNIAIGHRRLSIIDLDTGKQPMANEDETIWITYNGEIYNYIELREELLVRGHKFSTKSDTEIIIHAYEEWDAKCLEKFRGMFAFGIVDLKKRCLFLARDRFGIKPIYYRIGDEYFAFASELSALRKVHDKTPQGNLQAIDFFLRYQYIPTPHTIFKNIFKLPPGTSMIVDFNGIRTDPVNYTNLSFSKDEKCSDPEWEEKINNSIKDSVKAHLISDVPVGLFLSGGIDSTLIALNVKKNLDNPIKGFTICYNEKEFSELAYAELAAKKIGIDLHYELVTEDALDILPELISHYGEPFGDSSIIPTWFVSRFARKNVSVILSGDGGDETFAGYDSYINWEESQNIQSIIKNFPSYPILIIKKIIFLIKRKIIEKSTYQLSEWESNILYIGKKARSKLWLMKYQYLVDQKCELFENSSKDAQKFGHLEYAQYLDYQTYLPCDILTKVDIASMYHGLEVRPPFIDKEIFNVASNLPSSLKMKYLKNRGLVGKYVLKKLLQKDFPDDFIFRKKMGFAAPLPDWFLPGHKAQAMLENILNNKHNRLQEFFNIKILEQYMSNHSKKHDNSRMLWLFLVLGLWLEQNNDVIFVN
jgi:asparagine synthase (glutamine-hydrolysing)